MTVIFVLPAYNEAENLGPLLDEICTAMEHTALAYRVIVVDDGSTDDTYAVAQTYGKRLPILLEQNMPNEGLASALRKGLKKALEIAASDDVIITMDADNTHKPQQVPDLLAGLTRGADIAIASRYRAGAEIHGLTTGRKWLSRGAGLLFQACYPIHGARDYTCGYRAYRARLLRQAAELYGESFVSEQGFSCMIDALLKLHKLGARVTEIPLVLRYDLKKGESKMRVGRTIRQTLVLLLKRRLNIGILRP